MPDPRRCPDCGHTNLGGAVHCGACGYPLREGVTPGGASDPETLSGGVPAAPDAPGPAAPAEPEPPIVIARRRPIRPRRPTPGNDIALQLWLGVGGFCALLLVFVAVQANMERRQIPVEGSSEVQQKRADELRAVLGRDSTDIDARNSLADVLFDTGNWTEAVIHYRSAVNHDSTRVPAIVDLGVCYYNLGEPGQAESMFRLALQRDPHHPFALFNLGIVYERRGEHDQALQYFHRSLQSAPPENMRPAIVEAMQRVQEKAGKTAPPLADTP